MKNYNIHQGETIRLKVNVEEEGALTAELVAVYDTNEITKLVNFDGLVADLTTNTSPTQVPGEYEYYVRITWSDESVDILTKRDDCTSGDCGMPTITICELPSA